MQLITFIVKILEPRERGNIFISFNTNANICGVYEAVFVGYLNLPQNVIYFKIQLKYFF